MLCSLRIDECGSPGASSNQVRRGLKRNGDSPGSRPDRISVWPGVVRPDPKLHFSVIPTGATTAHRTAMQSVSCRERMNRGGNRFSVPP